MTDALLVGIDVGTQSTKAALWDTAGRCLAEANEPLPLRRRGPHHVDQDPEDFYRSSVTTVAACMRRAQVSPRRVAAVGIAAQMAGILGIARDGSAATAYDSWLDSRCQEDVGQLSRQLGGLMVALTGCPPMVDHAPKIRWLRRSCPGTFGKVDKFVVPSAYVSGRLCGLTAAQSHIDWTHLHFTGLANTSGCAWSEDLAEAVGVPLSMLPRIVSPTEVVGSLTRQAAEACGLLAGTPVAAGLGDTAAGALGAGMVTSGQVLDIAGTASVLAISTTEFRPDVDGQTLIMMRGALPGQWIALSYLPGGSVLRWLPQCLAGARQGNAAALRVLLDEALQSPPAANGLFFIPHLGGRLLPAEPRARGGWVGLQLGHCRGDLVRAVLESVAFEYGGYLERARSMFPELELADVRVIGGGSENALWNEIKSAVLGLGYVRMPGDRFSCWGAALVGGAAVGAIQDLGARAGTSQPEGAGPDPGLRKAYAGQLARYQELVSLLIDRGTAESGEEMPA